MGKCGDIMTNSEPIVETSDRSSSQSGLWPLAKVLLTVGTPCDKAAQPPQNRHKEAQDLHVSQHTNCTLSSAASSRLGFLQVEKTSLLFILTHTNALAETFLEILYTNAWSRPSKKPPGFYTVSLSAPKNVIGHKGGEGIGGRSALTPLLLRGGLPAALSLMRWGSKSRPSVFEPLRI